MPVERSTFGTITITGEAINLASWIALKHALRLQQMGIKWGYGRQPSTIAKVRLGIPTSKRPHLSTLITAVEAKIAELVAAGAQNR